MMENIRHLQLVALDILKIYDAFCREHNLKYSLYGGTLLGAVRHKGFIPWDDDLDVCMPRSDYDKFLHLWKKHHPAGYILQNKENSDQFTQSFSKIRKDHTTFLQSKEEAGKYHTGIFLDVFPLDRIPKNKFDRIVYKLNCMIYQLLTREFPPNSNGWILRIGSMAILSCIPKRYRKTIREKTLKKIIRYDDQPDMEFACIHAMEYLQMSFSPSLFDEYIELPFEDGRFMCIAGWDEYLQVEYGDYMQLPPKDAQTWKHHPLLIDFDRNYEEIPASERSL